MARRRVLPPWSPFQRLATADCCLVMNLRSSASIYDILSSALKQLIRKDTPMYTLALIERPKWSLNDFEKLPLVWFMWKHCASPGLREGAGISPSQTRTFINKYQKLRRKCSHASEQSHRVAGEASTDGEHCSAMRVASAPNKWGIVRPPFFMSSEPIINSFCLFLRKIFYL